MNIPFPHLLDDLGAEGKRIHAFIVYNKCVKHGKIHWAYKIACKYDISSRIDDRLIAFGWYLEEYAVIFHFKSNPLFDSPNKDSMPYKHFEIIYPDDLKKDEK